VALEDHVHSLHGRDFLHPHLAHPLHMRRPESSLWLLALILLAVEILFGLPKLVDRKGKPLDERLVVLGILLVLGLIWVVAACRLAHPSSWWARRFYGPEKRRRAEERFGDAASAAS
jgi:hypothetical protein